jgi:hypothetical protein
MKAMRANPYNSEIYYQMARIMEFQDNPEYAKLWNKFAEIAKDKAPL